MAGQFRQPALPKEPPLKGSFPLDHGNVCKIQMLDYMLCLEKNGLVSNRCRKEAKDYFECRMNNNLMLREDWDKLGLKSLPNDEPK